MTKLWLLCFAFYGFSLAGMKRLLFAFIFCAGTANADSTPGNFIHSHCANENFTDSAVSGWCLGYVIGAWEGLKLGSVINLLAEAEEPLPTEQLEFIANGTLNVCMPESVTYAQIQDVFHKHLEENPATRHETARSLLHTSLSTAFPCR